MPKDSPIDLAWSHWDRMRAGRAMPSRADLDPVDIPTLLSVTILIDVLWEPELDFRYRLVGTEMDRIGSCNRKGLRFSEIPLIERGGPLWSDHETVCRTGRPLRGSVGYAGPDRFVRVLEHGLFPLSSDGRTVTTIWCVGEVGR